MLHPDPKKDLPAAVDIEVVLRKELEKKASEISDIQLKISFLKRFPDSNDRLGSILVTPQEFRQVILSGPQKIFTNARFGPYVDKGTITGYYVESIENTHFLYLLGLRKADIIRAINNKPLTDQKAMLEVWKHMRRISSDNGNGTISVQIDRSGKIHSVRIEVMNKP